MKTIKLLFFTLSLFLVKSAFALNPASTFTLVNPCVPLVTITAIPNTYGCYSITTNNSVPNDPDSYYQWHFQDGTNGIGKTILHCCSPVTVTTNYTLSLTYNSPALCGPLPNVAVYTIVLNPPQASQCILNTPSVTLSANSVTVWAGVAIPEIFTSYIYGDSQQPTPNYTHTYAACGNYIIQVNQWDMNTPNDTCYAYAAVNINCATPNGIKDHSKKMITAFYPNPAKEVLTIKTAISITGIKVYDLLGKEVLVSFDIQNTEGKIYLEGLLPGAYIVKMQLDDGEQAYIKFIKE